MKHTWIVTLSILFTTSAWSAPTTKPTPAPEDAKKLKLDFKTGQIQIEDKEAKIKLAIPMDDPHLLLRNDYEEILVPKSMPKDRQQVANLLNLEAKYVSGHMSIPVNDKTYELSFTDFLSIQKYRAEAAAHKANPKNPAPKEFTKSELDNIQDFEKDLQTSILKLLDKAIPDENQKHLDKALEEQRKKFITKDKETKSEVKEVTKLDKMEDNIKSTTETTSVLIIGLIDNQPVVLHGIQYQAGLLTLKTPSNDLVCTGMQTDPLPVQQVVLHLDNYYAYLSPNAGAFSYSCLGSTCTAQARTASGVASCHLTDNIFKSGFETGETGDGASATQ